MHMKLKLEIVFTIVLSCFWNNGVYLDNGLLLLLMDHGLFNIHYVVTFCIW